MHDEKEDGGTSRFSVTSPYFEYYLIHPSNLQETLCLIKVVMHLGFTVSTPGVFILGQHWPAGTGHVMSEASEWESGLEEWHPVVPGGTHWYRRQNPIPTSDQ